MRKILNGRFKTQFAWAICHNLRFFLTQKMHLIKVVKKWKIQDLSSNQSTINS